MHSKKEQAALSMIKSKKFTPKQIQARTGLSLTWIEIKMREMGFLGQVL